MFSNKLIALASAPLFSACASTSPDYGSDASFLRGDMGTIQNFDDTLHVSHADAFETSTYVEMHVLGNYGWAMVGLNLWGETLGEGAFAPGESVVLRSGSIDADGAGEEAGGTAIGCSGPDEWDFEFDEGAEEIRVSFDEDDEGEIVIAITADFGSNGTVDGSTVVGATNGGVRLY